MPGKRWLLLPQVGCLALGLFNLIIFNLSGFER
jgi:hypothetical protein